MSEAEGDESLKLLMHTHERPNDEHGKAAPGRRTQERQRRVSHHLHRQLRVSSGDVITGMPSRMELANALLIGTLKRCAAARADLTVSKLTFTPTRTEDAVKETTTRWTSTPSRLAIVKVIC